MFPRELMCDDYRNGNATTVKKYHNLLIILKSTVKLAYDVKKCFNKSSVLH